MKNPVRWRKGPHKIIKIIGLVLIAATLSALLVFPRPAEVGRFAKSLAKRDHKENKFYG